MRERFAQGKTQQQIADELTAASFRSRRGNAISAQIVGYMIRTYNLRDATEVQER